MDTAAATGQPGVSLSIDGTVATIRLQRPERRNALTPGDLHQLLAMCERINGDATVRAVVLTSDTSTHKRPVFCAGYDVGQFDETAHDPHLFERTVDAIAQLRPVVIGAVNGSVYGGATDLVLACDLRIALADCEFRMPACALGLHYYPGGFQRFVNVLGIDGAKHAFLTARPLAVAQLAALGVFTAVCTAEDFSATLNLLVNDVVALAPLAAQGTKATLNELARGVYDLAAQREREALTLRSADFAEGRTAWAERRPARFKGR